METIRTDAELNIPWVESPFFEELLEQRPCTPGEKAIARFYNEHGYVILENAFEPELAEKIRREALPLFKPELQDGPNNFYARSNYRCQDAWIESQGVSALASQPQVLQTLRFLYGREPIPFQTLNFQFGSQQRAHSDVIHFSSKPARFMCGVWAALEDVDAHNGPLFYYPGSHKLPEYNYQDLGMDPPENSGLYGERYARYEDFIENLVRVKGLERKELHVKKGSILIWSANLIHGGAAIQTQNRTRWSQVTHYYFDRCLYYTPMHSDTFSGRLQVRDIRHIATGEIVPNFYNGTPIGYFWKDQENRARIYLGGPKQLANEIPPGPRIRDRIKKHFPILHSALRRPYLLLKYSRSARPNSRGSFRQ